MSKLLVHLVDDDDAVRTSVARLLSLSNLEVRQYSSGEALLEGSGDLDDGCILLDVNMPAMDGFAVLKALRDRSIDLPVIMMTGAGDLAASPLTDDIAAFLQKPFRREELMALLDRFGIRPNAEAKTP